MPNYPPQARDGGVVLFEVALNEAGGVTDTRGVVSTGGFESASREALAKWRFRGGSYRARPVPTTAYVLFGFRPPVGLASPMSADPPIQAAARLSPPPSSRAELPPPPPDFKLAAGGPYLAFSRFR